VPNSTNCAAGQAEVDTFILVQGDTNTPGFPLNTVLTDGGFTPARALTRATPRKWRGCRGTTEQDFSGADQSTANSHRRAPGHRGRAPAERRRVASPGSTCRAGSACL
jgi:hypothetical protein